MEEGSSIKRLDGRVREIQEKSDGIFLDVACAKITPEGVTDRRQPVLAGNHVLNASARGVLETNGFEKVLAVEDRDYFPLASEKQGELAAQLDLSRSSGLLSVGIGRHVKGRVVRWLLTWLCRCMYERNLKWEQSFGNGKI